MKRIFLTLAVALVILTGVLVVNTLRFTPVEVIPQPVETTAITPDGNALAQQLSEAITYKTISFEDGNKDNYAAFSAFTQWLEDTYPRVFNNLILHRINEHTLLLQWKGTTGDAPVLLSAHYDVVPVNPGTEKDWTHPPFAGVIDDGMIWGRGALDDKSAVIAIMASATALLEQGFTPKRDVFFAFTHDEELGSDLGAQSVVKWFEQRNIALAWSLDEGSFVLKDILPGMDKDIASINVAEKGFLTVKLTASGEGGHSSMPPQDTAVSILASAILKVKDAPLPGGLDGVSQDMYSNIARHMDFGKRMMFANLWLFKPLLNIVLDDSTSGNAMLRTTTAPTMLSGSVKSNVLPATATAVINFRLHPRDTPERVVQWVVNAIDDPRVTVETTEAFPASSVAPSDNQSFADLASSTQLVFPNAIVTPGLTIAATDSRFYAKTTNAYRFNPMVITNDDLNGFHGTNEKISIENMVSAVKFYTSLIQKQ
ncbi:M20 family peptidase [Aestuariibacter sp. A3R04]|uniref:M20 family peptidase n=1 Tax=Aestuariibacter sp. A3R04 TaxID=2841571 RepID=UPI001C08B3D3|nr:M20 family peptidase [Aestuariibacter sp. A3R04]MBU3023769.1 M20 family peptidase [Aestuariibacter sp. A3R04]